VMKERPVIGLTCGHSADGALTLHANYLEAVRECGGLPLIVSPACGDMVHRLVELLDGLLLTGGPDLDPLYYGEEPLPGLEEVSPSRDEMEIGLVREFLKRHKPVLGICRGCQVMNVAAGGSLYQDIATQVPGCIKHRQSAPRWYPTHTVHLKETSSLAAILGRVALRINSRHHQAVARLGEGFEAVARAPDGVIEAIELTGTGFGIGVQWHPEDMFPEETARSLFEAFIAAAGRRT